jgi:SAM-dependent methyltransferase
MARSRAGWRRWYRSWERQQSGFNRNRERRFSAMLDVLAAGLPPRFLALDLGSGPGPLSVRLLTRFPRARCVAVDHDPVVVRIGRGAFGTLGGRLAWVEADLGCPGWDRALPFARFDAAVSTTALHWLAGPRLGRLYAGLAHRLRRGGLFLNGDRLPWGDDEPVLSRLAEGVRRVRSRRTGTTDRWDAWRAWWKAAELDPELGKLFPLRAERGCGHPRHGDEPLSVHVRALRRAGFRTVGVVWRDLEDGILFARR